MNNNEKNKEYTAAYNDMFSEKGFDEMQLAKKYKIGFKLFRALFWVQYAAAMAVFCIAGGLENDIFTYIGAGLLTIGTVFYIVYLAKLASEGLMNAKFAGSWANIIWVIIYAVLILAWLIKLIKKDTDIFSAYMWVNLGALYLGNCFCSRKNMKVLEKMLKENDEEE